YESKMIWHYDHRFGTYAGVDSRTSTQTPTPEVEQYQNPNYFILPWYWVNKKQVKGQLVKYDDDGNIIWEWNRKWFLGFRDITGVANERTSVFSFLPFCGIGHTMPIVISEENVIPILCLFANADSLVLDFVSRQKVGGNHLTFGYVKQFPILPPSHYTGED